MAQRSQSEIDILIRLLLDQMRRDARQATGELRGIGREAKRAGHEVEQSFDDADESSVQLLRSFTDIHFALVRLQETAGRVGAWGRMGASNLDLSESFDYLAKRANISSGELIAAMKKAAKGTVTSNRIMSASNMVLGSRFNMTVEDMAKMMEFARLKAKQFGMSVDAAFNRMVYGAVKSEVEFLDELGIMIKLNDALKMYADKLGIAANKLTFTQRSQAIWNALLIQADDQLGEYGKTVELATDRYDWLGVQIYETQLKFMEFIDKSNLGPVLSIAAEGIQTLSPLLIGLISLKTLSTMSSLGHARAMDVETVAMGRQAIAADALTKKRMAEWVTRGGAGGGIGGGLKNIAGLPVRGARAIGRGVAGGARAAGGAIAGGLTAAGTAAAGTGGTAGALAAMGGAGVLAAGAVSIGVATAVILSWGYAAKRAHDVMSDLNEKTKEAPGHWEKYLKTLEETTTGERRAVRIAEEYAQKRKESAAAFREDGGALEDFGKALLRLTTDEAKWANAQEADVQRVLMKTSSSYEDYAAAVKIVNSNIEEYERRIKLISKLQYDLNTSQATGSAKLKIMADHFDKAAIKAKKYAVALGLINMAGMVMRGAEVTARRAEEREAREAEFGLGEGGAGVATQALQKAGLETDMLRMKTDLLEITLGKTTRGKVEQRDALEAMTRAYAHNIIKVDQLKAAIDAANKGTLDAAEAARLAGMATLELVEAETKRAEIGLRMTLIALDLAAAEDKVTQARVRGIIAARARARDGRLDALYQYHRQMEDLARSHGMRLEDIEYNYRRRLQAIQRRYAMTARKAAIERDALAILEAREARDEENNNAEIDRQDAVRAEGRSYKEQLYQAEQAYNDRLRQIEDALRQEVERLLETHVIELAAEQDFHQRQLWELKRANALLEAEAWRNAREMAAARALAMGGLFSNNELWEERKKDPNYDPNDPIEMQHGGSGTITGPALFRVEPGVREAFWFSGALNRGHSSRPPRSMSPAPQSVNVNVGGKIDVTGLGSRIGEAVSGKVTQTIVDALAESFSEARMS